MRKLVAFCAALILAAAGVSPAYADTGPGYNLLYGTAMYGSPYHQRIYLDRNALGFWQLNYDLYYTARQLHNVGIDIAYSYPGKPAPLQGRIFVVSYPSPDCDRYRAAGLTYFTAGTYPSGKVYIAYSTILICPVAFNYGETVLNAIVKHELGHTQGLAHFNDLYRGAHQIMSGTGSGTYDYQYGDLNGLSLMARRSALLRSDRRHPVGAASPTPPEGTPRLTTEVTR